MMSWTRTTVAHLSYRHVDPPTGCISQVRSAPQFSSDTWLVVRQVCVHRRATLRIKLGPGYRNMFGNDGNMHDILYLSKVLSH